MTTIPIVLDAATLRFYERVAENAGLPVAQVLADALFKLAGELSLEALHHAKCRFVKHIEQRTQ